MWLIKCFQLPAFCVYLQNSIWGNILDKYLDNNGISPLYILYIRLSRKSIPMSQRLWCPLSLAPESLNPWYFPGDRSVFVTYGGTWQCITIRWILVGLLILYAKTWSRSETGLQLRYQVWSHLIVAYPPGSRGGLEIEFRSHSQWVHPSCRSNDIPKRLWPFEKRALLVGNSLHIVTRWRAGTEMCPDSVGRRHGNSCLGSPPISPLLSLILPDSGLQPLVIIKL